MIFRLLKVEACALVAPIGINPDGKGAFVGAPAPAALAAGGAEEALKMIIGDFRRISSNAFLPSILFVLAGKIVSDVSGGNISEVPNFDPLNEGMVPGFGI
jgi:hypothetical protein